MRDRQLCAVTLAAAAAVMVGSSALENSSI